jgi:hypothetical protein
MKNSEEGGVKIEEVTEYGERRGANEANGSNFLNLTSYF